MREIKFRARNRQLDVMVASAIDIDALGVHAPTMQRRDVMARGDTYEVMQYTGLKDKNGVEIYEGDILDVDGVLNEIYWQEQHSGFWVREVPKQTEFYKSFNMIYISSHGEVIGNIYENPELLGGEAVS